MQISRPATNWDAPGDGFSGSIWPSVEVLPPTVVTFRRPYDSTNYALITLFLARFLCTNVANSRWRGAAETTTRAGVIAGIILAVWSLVFLSDDLGYCKVSLPDKMMTFVLEMMNCFLNDEFSI